MKNSSDKDRVILIIIVSIVVVLVTLQTINNMLNTSQIIDVNKNLERPEQIGTMQTTGLAAYSDSGQALMCLNNPPSITYDCNLTNVTLNINDTIACIITATDLNLDNITFSLTWNTSPPIFNIFPNGTLNFTPIRAAMDRTSQFFVHATDDSGCNNSDTYREYNVYLEGGNRPPVLIRPFPNQTLVKDYFYMLTMTDYFMDPEQDPMFFFYIYQSGSSTGIRMLGSRAEIRGLACGFSTVYYVAVDILGLSASSNTVTYEVTCPDQTTTPSGQNTDDGGGGGSGGGGNAEDCEPQWKCNSWSACQPGNYSYRRCLDYNGCSRNYEQFFFQNCTYVPDNRTCEERWDCNTWSTCENGIHTRTCMDMNNCDTNNTKPLESESCSKIPSCFNGIQDEGETGVDCGGACGACRNIEQPKIAGISTATIVAGIFVMAMTITLGTIYRRKIYALYRKIFGKKPGFKRKIYINEKQKERLNQILNVAQKRVEEDKISHAIDELSIFQKEYFKQLLALDSVSKQELVEKMMQLKDRDLEQLLIMFYAKISSTVHMRNKGLEIKAEEIQALIDEASHEIFLIAEFSDQDAILAVKDRTTKNTGQLEETYNNMSNLYIALKFSELIAAKNTYKDMIKTYETLSNKDKSIVYTDTIRAFHAINYLEKQYKG